MSEMTHSFEAKNGAHYEILPLTPEDAGPIGAVHLQSWIETYQNPELGIDEAWIREAMGHVAEESGENNGRDFRLRVFDAIEEGKPYFYRVAKDDQGEIVGFVVATRREDERLNQLDALYTLERVQGTGLGGRLMDEAMAWLGSGKDIELEVVAYNEQARGFYEHYGFIIEPDSKYMWKEPVEAIKMVRHAA